MRASSRVTAARLSAADKILLGGRAGVCLLAIPHPGRNLPNVVTSVVTAGFSGRFRLRVIWLSYCFCLAPRAGFEPATNRLTARNHSSVLSQGASAAGFWPFADTAVCLEQAFFETAQ
jgi:hypothetical protein